MFFYISNIDESKMAFVWILYRSYISIQKFILTGYHFSNLIEAMTKTIHFRRLEKRLLGYDVDLMSDLLNWKSSGNQQSLKTYGDKWIWNIHEKKFGKFCLKNVRILDVRSKRTWSVRSSDKMSCSFCSLVVHFRNFWLIRVQSITKTCSRTEWFEIVRGTSKNNH